MQSFNKLLSSFEIIEFIGTGAMSHVYKIQHKKSKRFYALKEVFLERKEDILSVISEKSLACQDINHPNLLGYQSIVVSTRMESLKRFYQEEVKSTVSKDLLTEYGIHAVCLQRPSSTLTNDSVDKQSQFCSKFGENIFSPKEESLPSTKERKKSENENSVAKKRKNSVKINKTEEKVFLKKDISLKYYHYLITHYSDFTLNDFIKLRNDYILNKLPLKEDLLGKMVSESLTKEAVNTLFVKRVMQGIFSGLAFLHSRKIVHGDISIYNIFFIENFCPKIGDYGDSFFGDTKEERNDLRKVGLIYFELLCPFGTVTEKHYAIQDLLHKKYPPGFAEKYSFEKRVIDECFSHKMRARDILDLF